MRSLLLALLMLSMSGFTIAGDVSTPGPEVKILSTMDIRTSPTSAPLLHRTNINSGRDKTLTFTMWTGDAFARNPTAHLWVLTDGYIDSSEPKQSLQGRGITIGHTPGCRGVGFEHFGINSGFEEGCIKMDIWPNTFYDVVINTYDIGVSVKIRGGGVNKSSSLKFTGDYLSYDTAMGFAFDWKSGTFGMFNVHQTIY